MSAYAGTIEHFWYALALTFLLRPTVPAQMEFHTTCCLAHLVHTSLLLIDSDFVP